MAYLSEKSKRILQLIADGRTYERILALHSDLTYKDIFHAAEEALRILTAPKNSWQKDQERIREKYKRLGERWGEKEEETLRHLYKTGIPTSEICRRLERPQGAIYKRLRKLKLMD